MSAENNSSSSDLPPPPITTSEFPTQNLPSEREDTQVQLERESLWDKFTKLEESLKGEYYYAGREEYPDEEDNLENENLEEEDQYPGEAGYLEEDEYLQEEKYLKMREYIFKGKYLERETYPRGKAHQLENYLEKEFQAAYSSLISSHLDARSPIASTSQGTTLFGAPRSITDRSTDSYSIKHQASQTKWAYESKSVLPWMTELKPDEETPEQSRSSHSEVNVAAELQQEDTTALESWNSIVDEAMDKEVQNFSDNFFRRSYQAVFKRIVREMSAANELEEDLNIPLNMLLQTENRKKLGLLLKENFETFEDPILWLMKRHEGLRARETSTFTFHLSTLSRMKESEPAGKKKVPDKKKVELDTEWIQEMTVRRGDGKLILYPNENVFQVLFPDGTGQIRYPSGRLALLISCTGGENFTYIILEDSEEARVRALVNNSGHATFYDKKGFIWSSLSSNLGYYFPKGKGQKAWNWWNLQVHVHMPPFQSISLNINSYIQVQIRSQDKIVFSFVHEQKQFRLNLGTRFKNKRPPGSLQRPLRPARRAAMAYSSPRAAEGMEPSGGLKPQSLVSPFWGLKSDRMSVGSPPSKGFDGGSFCGSPSCWWLQVFVCDCCAASSDSILTLHFLCVPV
ncbi:glutamate-rich protein 6B [Sciurus carolinensis]|uniref:glutamate-rich protein 6B n=1 Tax=Sciurus carolinensis TaxID=30640 RepID=UPI001FB28337|nr:glutamate-rich protein 6B [Sciurus carolinensis]